MVYFNNALLDEYAVERRCALLLATVAIRERYK